MKLWAAFEQVGGSIRIFGWKKHGGQNQLMPPQEQSPRFEARDRRRLLFLSSWLGTEERVLWPHYNRCFRFQCWSCLRLDSGTWIATVTRSIAAETRYNLVQGLAQWKRLPSRPSCPRVRILAFPKFFQRKFDIDKVNWQRFCLEQWTGDAY